MKKNTKKITCSFYIAVENEHVLLIFPYISDIATYAPESCYYACFVNFGCFLGKNRQLMNFMCFFSAFCFNGTLYVLRGQTVNKFEKNR